MPHSVSVGERRSWFLACGCNNSYSLVCLNVVCSLLTFMLSAEAAVASCSCCRQVFEQLSNAGTIFSSPQAAVLLSTGLPTAAGPAMLNQVGATCYRPEAVSSLL